MNGVTYIIGMFLLSAVIILTLTTTPIIPQMAEGIGDALSGEDDSSETEWTDGVVQHKEFSAGKSSTGMGIGIPLNVKDSGISYSNTMTPVIGGSSSQDKYIIFVNDEPHEIDPKLWLAVDVDDEVRYQKTLFGKINELEVIDKENVEPNNSDNERVAF